MTVETLPRQLVTCPTCKEPLPGLLAVCGKPECLATEIADDQRVARLEDL